MFCMKYAIGWVMRKTGVLRVRDLHHFYIMQAQDDVPFLWHERTILNFRIWIFDRICGPVND